MAKRGRPSHRPTPDDRDRCKRHAADGVPHEFIAALLKIDVKTMYKNYRDELDFGKAVGMGVACGKLREAIGRGEAWAICFFLKTQGGFRETNVQINRNVNQDGGKVELTKDDLDADSAMKQYLDVMDKPRPPSRES